MEDKARIWSARILAPIAFLAAATVLVVLVQRALDEDSAATADTTPAATAPAATEAGDTRGETSQERRFYRIRAGDTLEAIATQFDTTVERLLQLNPGVDPLALTPNERIRVS